MNKVKPMPKVTYFQGVCLPRTELVRAAIQEHVCAVQEFDHWKADLLEKFIISLGSRPDVFLGRVQQSDIPALESALETTYDKLDPAGPVPTMLRKTIARSRVPSSDGSGRGEEA